MPSPPELVFHQPIIDQRYHLEIWAEKTTQNDILEPLAKQYEINLVTGAGELSLTHCTKLLRRAAASGRPVRVLYISDFDPSGENMPVSVARKIEFALYRDRLDVDIQVRPIALTKDQCEEFELPRVPIKESDKRAGRWGERHGEGATELDALEALHPGSLREIVEQEVERYHDPNLDEEIESAASEIDGDVDAANEAVSREFEQQIADLEADWDDVVEKLQEWQGSAARIYQAMDASLTQHAQEIDTDIEWPEPAEGDECADPLFDSRRDYLEQIERYKRHQGKPITGLSRGGRQRRDGKRAA
jgi:hypothetical protein